MRISVMTSTGDDDLINQNEKGDLKYRRTQLKRLQNEVIDLEDMGSGISIMDLGLNEFRMDLLGYLKTNENLERTPFGIHEMVKGEKPGIIFVLKNVNEKVNIKSQNRLHPFYMVYIGSDGEVICNHLQPKDTLDQMRRLARGKSEPDSYLINQFNQATIDGNDMEEIVLLLEKAIESIINLKAENDLLSLFSPGGTTMGLNTIRCLDDFELVSFLVIR